MQHKQSKGINYFVCGASGAEYAHFYGGQDPERKMDWLDEKLRGFVIVSLTQTTMKVEFVSSVERPYLVVHTVSINKN